MCISPGNRTRNLHRCLDTFQTNNLLKKNKARTLIDTDCGNHCNLSTLFRLTDCKNHDIIRMASSIKGDNLYGCYELN